MVGFFMCQLFVKMFCLFVDHLYDRKQENQTSPLEGGDSWWLHRQHGQIRTAICPEIRPNVRTYIKCWYSEVTLHFTIIYYFSKQIVLHMWTNVSSLEFMCWIILSSTALNCLPYSNTARKFNECALIIPKISIDGWAQKKWLVNILL